MLRWGYAYLAVAALGLASSQPLLAQDGSEGVALRSPENAQKFLGAMAEQYKMTITATPWLSVDYPNETNINYSPIKVAALDQCTTEFSGAVSFFSAKYVTDVTESSSKDYQGVFARHQAEALAHGVKLAPYRIEWGKLTSIKPATVQYPSFTWPLQGAIRFTVDGTTYDLYTPSDADAKRVTLAMETLKQACDKTEGMGF